MILNSTAIALLGRDAIASINPSKTYALEMVLDAMRLVMGCDRV
ncbi:MAG: hypothetical protein AAF215_31610 [Cyanobacteria bacterium P01_A01_bin.123]